MPNNSFKIHVYSSVKPSDNSQKNILKDNVGSSGKSQKILLKSMYTALERESLWKVALQKFLGFYNTEKEICLDINNIFGKS